MTARDRRATVGTVLGLIALVLLGHDMWTGGRNPRCPFPAR